MPVLNSVNNQFLNDVLITTSTAGATSLLTISNLDNSNAASHSELIVSTGGASAGDAYIYFTNNVTDWTLGIDNSDSDSFVISNNASLGTTNVARCDTAGKWNYPLQSGFNAHNPDGALNVTGTGTAYNIVRGTEKFDTNADYDTGTSIFTAPVTGKYLFTSTTYYNVTIAYRCLSQFKTSNRDYFIANDRPANNNSFGAYGVVIADMDAGDTIYMVDYCYGEAADTDDLGADLKRNQFSGVLLQ